MIGDSSDIKARIYASLPTGWVADSNPLLDGVIAGAAYVLAFMYSLLAYVKLQMRHQTMTGGWLDMFAADFFGDTLQRRANESDDDYRERVRIALFRPKGTRQAVSDAVEAVTGYAPVLIEASRPADTLAYSIPQFGYGATGFYGSQIAHHQAIVISLYEGDPQDVYDAINSVKVLGTIAWTAVTYGSIDLYNALAEFVNEDGLPLLAE